MGCGAAEATGLGFVCFVVTNPCVLSANKVDLGFFCFKIFPILLPPPPFSMYLTSCAFIFACFCLEFQIVRLVLNSSSKIPWFYFWAFCFINFPIIPPQQTTGEQLPEVQHPTALHAAAAHDNIEAISLLLAAGHNVGRRGSKIGKCETKKSPKSTLLAENIRG